MSTKGPAKSVGVVIPLFNHEDYIAQALQSVIEQGEIVGQILVIDDGSQDDSLQVAQAVDDSRIRVIAQANQGAHAAINRGIAELDKGCEWVAILNSDDYYLAGRLQKCVAKLSASDGGQLAISALQLVDEHGQGLAAEHSRNRWYQAVRSLFSKQLSKAEYLGVANVAVTTSNFVGRRSWFEEHPFQDYRYVHDYRTLLDAAFADVLQILDEPLLAYRVHGSNTIDEGIRRLTTEVLQMNLELAADYAQRIKDDPQLRRNYCDYQRMAWSNISSYRQDTMQCLMAGLAAAAGTDGRQQGLAALTAEAYPELAVFPNKRLVGPDGTLDLPGETSGLAERLTRQEDKYSRLKETVDHAKYLIKLQQTLFSSKWLALGRMLGCLPKLPRVNMTTAPGQTEQLLAALSDSLWFKLGKLAGSKSVRKLAEMTGA